VSSTSTNKQPLLIDRPLHSWATLGPTSALTSSTNFSTIIGGGCTELVSCIDTDGAVVDSLSIMAMQVGTTPVVVLFFLSTSSTTFGVTDANTALVASALVQSSYAGERTNVELPPLCIPVPNLGAQASPSETSKKNTGIYVEAGQVLYVGINAPILAPTPATKINVFAQGGRF
jgi:hypothetical protein